MRRSMVFKLIQTHFAVQIPKILVIRQRIFMSFYENDKNKAITGWKFKSRKRIIKNNVYKKASLYASFIWKLMFRFSAWYPPAKFLLP